jgi:formamidopyrimidine-DNA glycosylase
VPELPEVETIRRSLLPRVVGRRITDVEVREPRLRRRIPPSFAARLVGQRVDGIERRAKYLLFRLRSGDSLVVHFGMSGTIVVHDAPVSPGQHDHVRLRLSDGAELVLNDPRRFGLLLLVPKGEIDALPELHRLGADPLEDDFSAERFRAALRHSRRPIKNLLLDQSVLAGLGNIYANEALFRARIRPTRRALRLRLVEAEELLRAIRRVLREAVDLGGSSIADYRDGNGRPGYFQLRLRVYDRAGEPCLQCGATVRRVVQSGRSSFYCPQCQH